MCEKYDMAMICIRAFQEEIRKTRADISEYLIDKEITEPSLGKAVVKAQISAFNFFIENLQLILDKIEKESMDIDKNDKSNA